MTGRCMPVLGPLGEFREGFVGELTELGYSRRSWEWQVRLLRELSGFLASRRLSVGELTPEVIAAFLHARRESGQRMHSERALVPLLGYLRRLGAVPRPVSVAPPVEPTLARFVRYLRDERGLAPATVAGHISLARSFLAAFPNERAWRSLNAQDVSAFVLRRVGHVSTATVRREACVVRALLRWMWQEEMLAMPLADAVGKFAVRGGDAPPRALTAGEVEAMTATLAASSTTVRSRNLAMVALMLRAGLRVGEVVSLCLEDIDWRAGVLRVRGKGARVDQVPLPVDVGRSLADYLQTYRPRTTTHREVFLSSCAPHEALSRKSVSLMVSKALHNAGVEGPGAAHRLRHTAACGVLASGGGLLEAGQLLRHRSLGVTAIYAKVDLVALRPLARPWPTAEVVS